MKEMNTLLAKYTKEVSDGLLRDAQVRGKDISIAFQDFLQWLIDTFSLDLLIMHNMNYATLMEARRADNPVFVDWLTKWAKCSDEGLKEHRCVDFFGDVYEHIFQSKSKAQRMQQYFTPIAVFDLLTNCLGVDDAQPTCSNEPSCGSGRGLLALWERMDWNKRHKFYAEDLDPVSVKMCALNMMINGMGGYVICHNTLLPDDFIFGYAINEVRDPIPCEYFSIRQISHAEFDIINPWQSEKPKKGKFTESLFDDL